MTTSQDNATGLIPRDPKESWTGPPPDNNKITFPAANFPPFMKQKFFRRDKILDGTIRTLWWGGQPYYSRFSNAGIGIDHTINPNIPKPPPDWPKQGTMLQMPKLVRFVLILGPGTARTKRWTDYLNSTVIPHIKDTNNANLSNLFVEITPISMTSLGSANGAWLKYIAPMWQAGGAYFPTPTETQPSGIMVNDTFVPFLGCNVLNVIIYQDCGSFGNYGYPVSGTEDLPDTYRYFYFDFLYTQTDQYVDVPTKGTAFQHGPFPTTSRNTEEAGKIVLKDDEEYIKKSFPYFTGYQTLIYYDSVPPNFDENEVGELFTYSDLTITDYNDYYYHSDNTIWTNGDGVPITASGTVTGGDYPFPSVRTFTASQINFWGSIDEFERKLLQQIATDLKDYGFQYKGPLDGPSGTIHKDIIKAFTRVVPT